MPFAVTCIDCRKPMPKSPCASCQRIRDAKRNADSYYQSPEWRALKRKAERAWGRQCFLCGSTNRITWHHLRPRAEGGPDIVDNLRPLCGRCHTTYEADAKAGRVSLTTQLVGALGETKATAVAVVGVPGSGKTHVRTLIHDALDLQSFAIDDYRAQHSDADEAWQAMLGDLRRTDKRCVVESNAVPHSYVMWLHKRNAITVLCTASAKVREQRLRKRLRSGDIDYRTMRMMLAREPAPIGVHIKYDTSHGTPRRDKDLVSAVAARLKT